VRHSVAAARVQRMIRNKAGRRRALVEVAARAASRAAQQGR
jgi:hypothetical protein